MYHISDTYISGTKVLSSDGSHICYADMAEGISSPLCSLPGCEHNNPDECMSIVSDNYSQEFVYVYNQRLIVGGKLQGSLGFFSSELGGSNHKKLAATSFLEDMDYKLGDADALPDDTEYSAFPVVEAVNMEYRVHEDKVYIYYLWP